jgi:hypothetical protein
MLGPSKVPGRIYESMHVSLLKHKSNQAGTAYRIKTAKGIILNFAIYGPQHRLSGKRVERMS